ncbi:MAG: hypothetical protein HKN11_05275 [Rhizobiales bacterium]|nr:hypothetical protein [Hyphomicrobiales bacterium]
MSQIETIMLVTLGFVVVALLALFFSRLVWSFGVTLGKRRTERSAPATIASLQAERDQLRAESAMLSRKLELRLDDLKTRLAEQTAEVSRNRNRIDHLIKEVEKRNAAITEREEEINQLNRQIEPLEAELATRTHAMQQLKEQIRQRDEGLTTSTSGQKQIVAEIAERDRELASLRAQLSDRDTKHKEISAEAQTAQDRLQNQIRELTALSNQIELQRADMSAQYDEITKLKSDTEISSPELDDGLPVGKPATSKKTKSTSKSAKRGTSKSIKVSVRNGSASPTAAEGAEVSRNNDNVDDKVKVFESKGQALEQQIRDAERETDQLQDELKKLDQVWAEKIAALNEVAPQTLDKRSKSESDEPAAEQDEQPAQDGRSRHNVISLAARIRALQDKSAEN